MTPDREKHLLHMIGTITSLDELDGFRSQLSSQQEITADIMAAIRDRQDDLFRGGFRRGKG